MVIYRGGHFVNNGTMNIMGINVSGLVT